MRYGDYEQVNGATLNAALEKIEKLEAQIKLLKDGLRRIRDIDYRGNRHESAHIAESILFMTKQYK